MRIMWLGPHPDLPTGYAGQARTWVSYLAAAGHDVAVLALAGQMSHMGAWKTLPVLGAEPRIIPVYPSTPYEANAQDVLATHAEDFAADLVISLTCTWVLKPPAWRDLRAVMITPVDVAGLRGHPGMSRQDYEVIIESGATPAAVCRWGETQMRSRGLEPLYLPHGVDTGVFRPLEDRKKIRQVKGLTHRFVAGVNAMNHERDRKNLPEVFQAFRLLLDSHPDSMLALHALAYTPEGLNLMLMAAECDISDRILWSDQGQLASGTASPEAVADWAASCDVIIQAGNEGFGLPTVEAMACGTPVIAGDWGPHRELTAGTGWLVEGQPKWNNWHGKWWRTPHIDALAAALAEAYDTASDRREAARKASLSWDAERVWEDHWEPVIKDLE